MRLLDVSVAHRNTLVIEPLEQEMGPTHAVALAVNRGHVAFEQPERMSVQSKTFFFSLLLSSRTDSVVQREQAIQLTRIDYSWCGR